MLLTSISALFLRQTNIFWVAVYFGGLEIIRTVRKGRPAVEFPHETTFSDIIHGSWEHASLYDPFVCEAGFEGHQRHI